MKSNKNKSIKTDWGQVASWYDNLIKDENSYQAKVILPNLLRLLGSYENIKNKNILDIACGSGYFGNIFASLGGANILGIDLGKDLIETAINNYKTITKNSETDKKFGSAKYFVGNAESFTEVSELGKILLTKSFSLDYIICTLAIQNIKDIESLMIQIKKVATKNTKIFFVINHPTFRIPQYSDWYLDLDKNCNYRMISKYMSQISIQMDMNPGQKIKNKKIYTYSFHRPLQYYIKLFSKNGFVLTNLEEWISHKVSEKSAKRKIEEDNARKEIPIFMMLQLEIR